MSSLRTMFSAPNSSMHTSGTVSVSTMGSIESCSSSRTGLAGHVRVSSGIVARGVGFGRWNGRGRAGFGSTRSGASTVPLHSEFVPPLTCHSPPRAPLPLPASSSSHPAGCWPHSTPLPHAPCPGLLSQCHPRSRSCPSPPQQFPPPPALPSRSRPPCTLPLESLLLSTPPPQSRLPPKSPLQSQPPSLLPPRSQPRSAPPQQSQLLSSAFLGVLPPRFPLPLSVTHLSRNCEMCGRHRHTRKSRTMCTHLLRPLLPRPTTNLSFWKGLGGQDSGHASSTAPTRCSCTWPHRPPAP
ncbi:hypothetical protein K438DRAFT_1828414 [Mycena galopus ATCC 62051]|nr:hypothetical protein K438DRAFT_1828414 [Mycena galopus ATCC 62051]